MGLCRFLVHVMVFNICRKRVLAVLQDMMALPQTPSSLISLLTEKLLSLIPDDHRRIQTVGSLLLCCFTLRLTSTRCCCLFAGGRNHLGLEGTHHGAQSGCG